MKDKGPRSRAEMLNDELCARDPAIYALLSRKGKALAFPQEGVVRQGEEAASKSIDATIGIALEEDGSPMRLSAVARRIDMDPSEIFPYASTAGKGELRELWRKMLREKNPGLGESSLTLPVVTNAITNGISLATNLFADREDTVIIPSPYWGNYNLILQSGCGARTATFPLFEGDRFNVRGLRGAVAKQAKKVILLLNFPNNPTGFTPRKREGEAISRVIEEAAESGKKIVVLCDDAYGGLVYEEDIMGESCFASLASRHRNLLAIKLDGATKEDYGWGLRVGFITYACRDMDHESGRILEEKTKALLRGTLSNVSHVSQSLLLRTYLSETYQQEKREKRALLHKRYQKVREVWARHPEYNDLFQLLPFNSGYFMCLKPQRVDAEQLRRRLLEVFDTGVIALKKSNIIRVTFAAVPCHRIETLYENLYRAAREVEA